MQMVVESFSVEIEKTFGIKIQEYDSEEAQVNADSLCSIIKNIQVKYVAESQYNVKVSLLTLLPENWSYSKTRKYFECTSYMLSTARSIKEKIGKLISLKKYN